VRDRWIEGRKETERKRKEGVRKKERENEKGKR
jgi:hypothetical protein